MNKVTLIGRMVKDVEVRYSQGENSTAIARFTVACDRRGKDKEADFINCLAFGKSAEFIGKYFSKGNRIGINGRIQTGSYTNKDGQKVYTTDVVVEEAEFVESKKQEAQTSQPAQVNDGWDQIPDGVDEEGLPWA